MSHRGVITSYSGIHVRLRRERGRAAEHFCSCGAAAAHWAYQYTDPDERTDPRGIAYSVNIEHYRAMCRRCHQVFDKSRITHCPQGHEYTPENTLMDSGKRKCKTCHYARKAKRKPTSEQRARMSQLQRERRASRTPEEYERQQAREALMQRRRRYRIKGDGS